MNRSSSLLPFPVLHRKNNEVLYIGVVSEVEQIRLDAILEFGVLIPEGAKVSWIEFAGLMILYLQMVKELRAINPRRPIYKNELLVIPMAMHCGYQKKDIATAQRCLTLFEPERIRMYLENQSMPKLSLQLAA